MIKVSDLLSKQLICLDSASIVGTISDIVFDDRLTCGKQLVLFCEDDDNVENKFVDLKNVTALNEDAGVIKSCDQVLYEWNALPFAPNPINRACFNQDGKHLGIVRDILLSGTKVEKILLNDGEFFPKDLLSYSNELLIVNDSGKPIKINRAKPKIPMPPESAQVALHNAADKITPSTAKKTLSHANNTPISNASLQPTAQPLYPPTQMAQNQNVGFKPVNTVMQPINYAPLTTPKSHEELRQQAQQAMLQAQSASLNNVVDTVTDEQTCAPAPTDKIDIPSKILQDNTQVHHSPATDNNDIDNSYKFLLGKPVHTNILDNNGNIIIAETTLVTAETIRIARQNGKLVQLALRAY